MKKTIATLLTVITFLSTSAQIEKATNSIGLNLGAIYNNNNSTYQNIYDFGLNTQPVFEHFIDENLSLGLALNYGIRQSYSNNTFNSNNNNSEYNFQNFGAQIQLKKYWFATNKIAFTFTPVLSLYYYETNSTSSTNNGSKSTNNYNNWIYNANCNLGALYFIKQNLAIEAQTNFINYSFVPENSNLGNISNFSLSIVPSNLMLGVKFFLGKTLSK